MSRRKSSDPLLVASVLTDCSEAFIFHLSAAKGLVSQSGSLCKNSLMLINVSLELSTDISESIWIELSLIYTQ